MDEQSIAGEFNYHVGTAIVHLWRLNAGAQFPLEDIRKAIRHLEFECARLELSDQTVSGTSPVPSPEQDDPKYDVDRPTRFSKISSGDSTHGDEYIRHPSDYDRES